MAYDLPNEFYEKLRKVIKEAEEQLSQSTAKNENIIYLIINFDEDVDEPQEKYFGDINRYIAKIGSRVRIVIHKE